eukprot:5235187-Amphidinium_carterae.1
MWHETSRVSAPSAQPVMPWYRVLWLDNHYILYIDDVAVTAMSDADGKASGSGSSRDSDSYYGSEYSYSYSNCSQPSPGNRCMGHPDDLVADYDNTDSARSDSEPATVADELDEPGDEQATEVLIEATNPQAADAEGRETANPDALDASAGDLPAVLATVAATDEDMETAAQAALEAADEDEDNIKVIDLIREPGSSLSATPFLGVVQIAPATATSTTAGREAPKAEERQIPIRGVFVAKAAAPAQMPQDPPVAESAQALQTRRGKPETEEEWKKFDQGQGQFYLGMALDNYPLLQQDQSEGPILTELGHDIGLARRKVQAYRAVAANYLHAASTEFWHQVWFLTWGSKKMRELDVAELCSHFSKHALCDQKRLQYIIWSTLKGFLEVTTSLNSTWETLCTRVDKPKSKNGWQAILEAAGLPTKREVANTNRIMYRPPKAGANETAEDTVQGSAPVLGKASVPPTPPPAPKHGKHGKHGKRPRSNLTISDAAMMEKFGT